MPRFVYRALRSSGEDGPKRSLLCSQCEDRLSVWESHFARDIFHPLVAGESVAPKYGRWLSQFAASVCWRILADARRENQLLPLNGRWTTECDDCLKTWGDFLRGRRPDPGTYALHLLNADEGLRDKIAFDVAATDTASWVYARLGPIILLGLIHDDAPQYWKGTRIRAEGKLKPRQVTIPAHYREWLDRV